MEWLIDGVGRRSAWSVEREGFRFPANIQRCHGPPEDGRGEDESKESHSEGHQEIQEQREGNKERDEKVSKRGHKRMPARCVLAMARAMQRERDATEDHDGGEINEK